MINMSSATSLQASDIIYRNARIATMNPEYETAYGLLINHDLIVRNDQILALVPYSDQTHENTASCKVIDLQNQLLTPGLIDCHTHLVFGGNRAAEWEMRLNGKSYTEIAANGGGINASVNATRLADFDELYKASVKRLNALMQEGVTLLESKSGYGLDLENERKQLLVAKKLGENFPIEIATTLLSAHAVPAEFKDRADDYIDEICQRIMPTLWAEKCFEAADVFCEKIGFTLAQTKKLFDAAQKLGIPVKGHMEQLSNLGASALLARYNGLSVDHIEYLDEAGILALKNSNTVATLLPIAYYFLKETQKPPIDLLRQHKIPMAISTDFNPGTAPIASLRLAMNMASSYFGLNPEEVIAGVTRNAAQALGRTHSHGQIKAGFKADFIVWDLEYPVEIFYELGHNPLTMRVFHGQVSHLVNT